MYITTKYIDVGQENRVIKAEISNGNSMVKLEILSKEPLDETSTDSLTSNWDIMKEENVIKLN